MTNQEIIDLAEREIPGAKVTILDEPMTVKGIGIELGNKRNAVVLCGGRDPESAIVMLKSWASRVCAHD